MTILLLVTLIGQLSGQVSITAYGVMDEMLVMAPRMRDAVTEDGMLPEIVVTAPQYEGKTVSHDGLLPEVLVTAPRYDTESYDGTAAVFNDGVPSHSLGIILY
jgi:uncharacterized membrane protein